MSSVDQLLRSMVQAEVARAIAPLAEALEEQGEVLARFAAAFGAPLKRGPGRPRKLVPGAAKARKAAGGKVKSGGAPCAIIGCKKASRAKGYCAAHYQKYRMLAKTGRLPADWAAEAAPQSVKNVVLPRGRAGAKALAEARKKGKG